MFLLAPVTNATRPCNASDTTHSPCPAVHRRACAVPQLVQLTASGQSAEWLADSSYLARVLQEAGVADDEIVADAVYWVATTTLGHAMMAAAGHGGVPLARLRATLDR